MKSIILLAFATCCALAQNSTISGTVSTQSGGPLANATVNLDNLTTNTQQSTVTDTYGKYHFDALPSGRYRISMSTALRTNSAPRTHNARRAGDQGTDVADAFLTGGFSHQPFGRPDIGD